MAVTEKHEVRKHEAPERPPREPAAATVRLTVYRYKRGDGAERFERFEVPAAECETVLDALRWIQLHRDPSLTLRHSCMHASCGTCGVRVNGREELACVCALAEQGEEIRVEPLANLPVLTDLVVEMAPFYERFRAEHPIIRASEALPGARVPDGHDAYVRLESCIECGLCLSACPVAATATDYLGPAALAAAARLIEEPRGADPEDVLAWANCDQGVWRCHVGLECTNVCPVEAIPAERIMALRRELTFGHHDHRKEAAR